MNLFSSNKKSTPVALVTACTFFIDCSNSAKTEIPFFIAAKTAINIPAAEMNCFTESPIFLNALDPLRAVEEFSCISLVRESYLACNSVTFCDCGLNPEFIKFRIS